MVSQLFTITWPGLLVAPTENSSDEASQQSEYDLNKFIMPRRSTEQRLSSRRKSLNHEESTDTSPFSTASFDSAIGDMFSSTVTNLDLIDYGGSLLSDLPTSPPPLSHVSSVRGVCPTACPTPPSGRGGKQSVRFRGEVEQLCVSLMCQYQHSLASVPSSHRPPDCGTDNLLVVTRLLSQAVARMRFFLSSLDSFNCLSPGDRAQLYRHNICTIQILKAAISVDLGRCHSAFPLPYGENLGETEAFHLITAHELYTELRGLIYDIQSADILGIRELPVMLLIMMVAFFKPGQVKPGTPGLYLEQPDRVGSVYHFYSDKLQAYLLLRYGPNASWNAMNNVKLLIDRVKLYSVKLKEFLDNVTSVGLQTQYEAVTENLGLIAFLIQSELNVEANH